MSKVLKHVGSVRLFGVQVHPTKLSPPGPRKVSRSPAERAPPATQAIRSTARLTGDRLLEGEVDGWGFKGLGFRRGIRFTGLGV